MNQPLTSRRKTIITLFALCWLIVNFQCTNTPTKSTDNPELQRIENAEHVVVYQENDKFLGWPANNGAWSADGVNMLVGFTHGDYELIIDNHNIGGNRRSWLARSTDMGKTWQGFDPEGYVGDFGQMPDLSPVDDPIDFSHPQFAMRIVGTAYHGAHDDRGHFFFSYDAGQTWKGPFSFGETDLREWPELKNTTFQGELELTPRTDYIVEGENECLIFMSVRSKGEFGTDRLFCARTYDGGKSFEFVGWVIPPYDEENSDPTAKIKLETEDADNPHPHQARAVMSQTIRLKNGHLICAMRRRYEKHNWVDAYVSKDRGQTWTFLSEVGDAGAGNGNPPALNVTDQGRLVAVFGNREEPGTMMVVYSDDEGQSWSAPKILRDGYGSEDMETIDLGYPLLLQRKDGQMVALYYWSTQDQLHHIAATIWDADH
ncbi:glycoside hydrolase [Membranicola marinus]|uniref:Glycoside hydrolase n=1 Tax=Membranihabitans marinus TaxID=1227546 RepID=A0A953HR90_9BACT|nr:sialidase family protein [Membranihabitans marinus]MBY5959794.1 glycoside hydrolase [Membranihabitans marinus]